MWCGVSCVFVIWNGSWCGMWCGSKCGLIWNGMWDVYNVTAPHTLPHCTTAQCPSQPHNSTSSLCYTLHTMQYVLLWCDDKWCMLCDVEWCMWCDVEWYVECVTMLQHHALSHHTTTWFCDTEWCMMWCGAMWNEIWEVHHALPHRNISAA